MKLFNNLTGKSKLIDEINELKKQLNHCKIEIREKADQILFLQKRNKETINQFSLLKKKATENGELLLSKEMELSDHIKEIHNRDKVIKAFQKSYGALSIEEEQNKSSVSEYDEDKSFFDYIKPKNDNNDFNNDQVTAIRYNMEKHLRIIAGAGSGKTQTICAKAAYLVMMENVPQEKIAMITFTTKAAGEMKERVQDFLEEGKTKLSIGTFHGIFQAMYNELKNRFPYVSSMGINGGDPIHGEKQYKKLLNNLIKKYKLKILNDNGEKSIFEKISYWTNMCFTIEEMTNFIQKHYDQLESLSEEPMSQRFLEMMNEFQSLRKDQNIVIFDDYLINLLHVLQEDIEARNYIQQRFQYVFIDEFQDTNPLQMEIIKLICPPEKEDGTKLIIVGDDDQSIYFFRGAEPKFIKEFDQIYLTHTQKLMTNYRSIAQIVQAGNRVISYNANSRIQKTMEPFHNKKGDCFIQALPDPEDEAEWIIMKVKELGLKKSKETQKTVPDYNQSVLLYRSNTQLKTLLHHLEVNNVPFVIEANEDLMGIFNIDHFRQVYKYWSTFINEEVNKIPEWNNIVTQTAYAFYKKRAEVAGFITDRNKFIDPHDAAEFICSKNNQDKKKVVIDYLSELVELKKNKKVVSMKDLIKKLLTFPLFKHQLTKEEIKWIELEAENFSSWEKMNNRYNQLRKTKEEMRKKLQEYHQGIYNAFYLLTIHKSKGLSFENVFLIGVHNEGLPNKRAVKSDSNQLQSLVEQAEPPTTIEEERRLMYVAVTRPKKNLYITFPTTVNNKPIKRSIFLKEINLPVKK